MEVPTIKSRKHENLFFCQSWKTTLSLRSIWIYYWGYYWGMFTLNKLLRMLAVGSMAMSLKVQNRVNDFGLFTSKNTAVHQNIRLNHFSFSFGSFSTVRSLWSTLGLVLTSEIIGQFYGSDRSGVMATEKQSYIIPNFVCLWGITTSRLMSLHLSYATFLFSLVVLASLFIITLT